MTAAEDVSAPQPVGPYGAFARAYRAQGWAGVLPLPQGQKAPVPSGFTGRGRPDPSDDDVARWCTVEGLGNIGLRLPDGVVGIDVDAYGEKRGGQSLEACESLWGQLPPTWCSTSREDGVSGIRLYRVPPGLEWSARESRLGPGIELLHTGHRYAVVFPSRHPGDAHTAAGALYRWIDPDGTTSLGAIPSRWELPELPAAWVQALTEGESARPATDRAEVADWLGELDEWNRPGECGRMTARVHAAVESLHAGGAPHHNNRHSAAAAHVLVMVGLAARGHAGLGDALTAVQQAHDDTVGLDRPMVASREFERLTRGAVGIVLAEEQTTETCHGPSCGSSPLEGVLPPLERHETASTTMPGATPAAVPTASPTGPVDMTWILHGEPPEPLVPSVLKVGTAHGLFYAGKVNGLFGDPETAKTWIALCAVVEVLQGGGRAVLLDLDHNGHATVGRRLLALGASREAVADVERFRLYTPEDTPGLAAFVEDAVTFRPAVAVVDSIGELLPMLGMSSKDNDEITRVLRWVCVPLAECGAATVTIDHLPKSMDSRVNGYAIGGTAKKRAMNGSYIACEVVGTLTPSPGAIGKIRLTIEKDREGGLRAASGGKRAGVFVLDSTTEGVSRWSFENDSAPTDGTGKKRFTQVMQNVSEVLEAAQSAGETVNRAEVGRRLRGKAENRVAAIADLVAEHYVRVEPDGALVSLKPYRQVSDPLLSGGFEQPSGQSFPSFPSRSHPFPGTPTNGTPVPGNGTPYVVGVPRERVPVPACTHCGGQLDEVSKITGEITCSNCARNAEA